MEEDILKHSLIDTLHNPEELRKLDMEQLPEVCKELREDIIKEVSCNPGHFAASLGTVELTVALHYIYNTPYDRIVWDVGHQAYGHKILTGRRDSFSTNRKLGGIKPFPSPEESEYDTFACGHASNSISAALGMAVAAKHKGETDRHVVAVIGDGSMSGGLDLRPFPANWEISKRLGNYASNQASWNENSVMEMIPLLSTNRLALLIDCGEDDFFYPVNLKFHEQLKYNK